jgi:hypothetical protein
VHRRRELRTLNGNLALLKRKRKGRSLLGTDKFARLIKQLPVVEAS